MKEKQNEQEILRATVESQLAHTRPAYSPVPPPGDMQHELQVHEIELEMQNEALRQSGVMLEESRDRYVDFYDFAPVGYLTLSHKALIAEINHTGAAMLGEVRSKLLRRPFSKFLAPEHHDRWYRHFMDVQQQGDKLTCELDITHGDDQRLHVQLDSLRLVKDGQPPVVRIALTDITELKRAETALRESESRQHVLEQQKLIQTSLDGFWVMQAKNARILDANNAFCEMVGYSREELLSMRIPDLEAVETPEETVVHSKEIKEIGYGRFETRHRHKQGHLVDLEVSASYSAINGGEFFVFVRDVTERKLAEKYEQFRSRTLELLSGGASLPDLLEGIVRGVEQLNPEMMCSILLLDSLGKRLGKGIAPNLPGFYNTAIDGIEIGIGVGSCGTAAATGERVIVDDIQTHPYWAPYKELAAKAGLGACWSEPIRSSSGQVLGTFATYHREAHSPTEFNISVIEKSVHLVSIAIERKQAEEALRASEQEFRTLAENLPDNLVRYDREGRRTYVNPALERWPGVTTEQMIGKTLRETNPYNLPMETYQRALEHTLATGERSEFEMQMAALDGNICTHLCFIVAERMEDGRISGAISVSRDITERKRMESEIRRREREFRSLAENSPDPIFRYDRDCRRIYANPASSVMSGHPVATLVGATPDDGQLLAADDAARLTAGIRRVFDSSESGCVDTVSVDRDGKQREYQVLLVPEQDEKGNVAAVLGLARDITAIRDAERRMTEYVANLPGFAYTFRRSPEGHGSFPFVSPGIEKLVGLKPEDVKNDWAPLLSLAHPDDAPRIIAALDESARTMTPYQVETRARRPDSSENWTELRSVPVRQADGSILWHGIMLDIDKRKRNESELERHRQQLEKLVEDRTHALSIAKETAEAATRAKSQFLAAASHDMRQPLQAIILFNEALSMTRLDKEQTRISSHLSKSVNSLGDLLNELLDLSRLDAGMIEPQPVVIQAEDLLGMIGAEFDAVFREKNLSLRLFCPLGSLILFSDKNLLLTLLRNLVGNAVKYTARGGVLVSIRQREDRALIQVWDTGIGISPELSDSIFEEYFQVGNPERDRAKGVGLGLAIVRRLSKLLGFGVRLHSRVGKGSVFELSVPLADKSDMQATAIPVSATQETIASTRLAGKRVVVIEDDATVAEAIKLTLEMEGAHITLFGTAEEALGNAEIMGADFYISDYRLPGRDGLQLLDAIQTNSAVPIRAVLLTGNTSTGQFSILQSSRWEVIFKPINLHMLLTAIER